jgi:putative phage-type endonuclease
MLDETHCSIVAVIITVYNRFFPDKCDDESISEIIEYMETSTDYCDLKKQNINFMISELLADYDGQKAIRDMIDAVEMVECPYVYEIKELITVMMMADEEFSASDGDKQFTDFGELCTPINEFIPDTTNDELLREINEVIHHNNSSIIAEPKYKEIMTECVREHFDSLIEDEIVDEDEFEQKASTAIDEYYRLHPRQGGSSYENDPNIAEKLKTLSAIDQADQRTAEWYEQRHSLITASSAWKLLDSQANFNSYVLSKCLPYQPHGTVNINSPLHWGQKYEPVSVELYEMMFNTHVGEFGCIPHPTHKFLGASPDGINIDPASPRYGRMLEIKNIVNREINGVPKKEYWIQMQLQMEVCDLNCCDFLETAFKEYPSSAEFELDAGESFNKTASGEYKGTMAMFYKGTTPMYDYCPLKTTTIEEYEAWMENVVERNSDKLFIKYIYWRLETMSLVTVLRNKEWFAANVDTLRNGWETIQREKVSGFEHRKPNKKVKKEAAPTPAITFNITTNIDHLDDEEEL